MKKEKQLHLDVKHLMNYNEISVYWQIKHISVSPDRVNDPGKFDRMMEAIRWSRNVDGYSRILWVVSFK